MPKARYRKGFNLFVVVLLVLSMIPAQAWAAPSPATILSKLIVDNQNTTVKNQVGSSGGNLLADYGSFSLWQVPESVAVRLATNNSVSLLQGAESIELRDATLDTTKGEDPVAANFKQTKSGGEQFWLVQFVGPIKEDWLNDLNKNGIEIVIYMPNNAYVIWASGNKISQLEASVGKNVTLQWTGAYHPAYRLEPSLKSLKSASPTVDITVQFYNHSSVNASLSRLQSLGGQVKMSPSRILNFLNISLTVPSSELVNIANWNDVFNVEPWVAPTKRDEVQGQIVAGNFNSGTGQPTAPGYLAWLASKGFPTTPASYPIIDVVDDGVDNGTNTPIHPDFYELGSTSNPDRLIYNQNCTTDANGNAVGGHGNINAGIVGSYNALAGAPHIDGGGYNRGLGISPYTRLASTKIFRNSGPYDVTGCLSSDQGVVQKSFDAGATITTNSWGANVGGAYNASSQAYDTLTRDASLTNAGSQQLLHIFSAGNAGPGLTSVGSPGTGKNVFTVGATENVRDQGVVDGCNLPNANNANDIAGFSSRGPTTDLRAKPDIVAPGTHVQGPASQDPGYDGSGVCGGTTNFSSPQPNADRFYPPGGQTLYTWSSGTSHSTPAVAGAASLLYNYYGRVLSPGQTPSPAMLKALMLNSPRYLNGTGTGGTLPSTSQGWGNIDLGLLFDGTPRFLVDQSTRLSATGQNYLKTASVVDNTKPLRVSLVWTDAPGSTTGNSFVNNLDLEVTIGAQVYKGNVFSGANSATGGSADIRNNVENVFIPAGATGSFSVKVTAANLAGDGVPGVGNITDQDFALVIYNAADPTPASITASGGGGQETLINTPFTNPLQATVRDASNAVLPGITVTFTAPASGASGIFSGSGTTANAVTNASGVATSPTFIANGTVGNYSVTANVSPTLGTAANFALVNLSASPVNISATAGTPQSAIISTTFATALQATVTDNAVPLSGLVVTFSAPGSGASGTFAGGVVSTTAVTDANGVATAPAFTANGTTGSYTVTASVSGAPTSAGFNLTNNPSNLGNLKLLANPIRIAATTNVSGGTNPLLTASGAVPQANNASSSLLTAGGVGAIPANAKGIVGIVTNVGCNSGGNLRFWTGATVPDANNLNIPGSSLSIPNVTTAVNISTGFISPLDATGKFNLGWGSAIGKTCGYAVDIVAYLSDAGQGGSINLLTNTVRLAATTNVQGGTDPLLTATGATPQANTTGSKLLTVWGVGSIPNTAKGVIGIVTNVGCNSGGNLRFWTGATTPNFNNLNIPGSTLSIPGATTALNLSTNFIAALDANGQFNIGWGSAAGKTCGYAIDIAGYITDTGNTSVELLANTTRIAATTNVSGGTLALLNAVGAIPANGNSSSVNLNGWGTQVPNTARGIFGVLTNVGCNSGGNLRFWTGLTVPNASNHNVPGGSLGVPGATTAFNLSTGFLAGLDATGKFNLGWGSAAGKTCGYALDVSAYLK